MSKILREMEEARVSWSQFQAGPDAFRVGDMNVFKEAIDSHATVKDETVPGATYCGIKIVEDARLPANMMAVMRGDEVLYIVKIA